MRPLHRPVLLALCIAASTGAQAADAPPAVAVQTQPVRRQEVSDTLAAYGSVTPVGGAETTLSTLHAGRVRQLHVAAGQRVRRGEALFDLAATAADRAAYAQAQSAVTFAEGELRRTQRLYDQRLATASQLASAHKALDDARSSLAALNNSGAGQAVDTVRAPFDATVSALVAGQGEVLAAGAPVLKLARTGAVQVQLGIEPEDVPRVQPGMAVTIRPLLGRAPATYSGRVASTFGAVDPQSRLVDVAVQVQMQTPRPPLLLGSRVQGDIVLTKHTVLTVPRSAVLNDEHGEYLFVVTAQVAHRVAVQVQRQYGDRVAVTGALQPGQPVVAVGNYELDDGMHVRDAAP